jgi:hypothetical protein
MDKDEGVPVDLAMVTEIGSDEVLDGVSSAVAAWSPTSPM